jgi:hypothetical protein
MPPSCEEQAAIKRRLRALDAQPWFRAMVEKRLAERRAKRAAQAAVLSTIRWALCRMRSQMASARVASPR